VAVLEANQRRVFNGNVWVLRTGAPYQDLPARYELIRPYRRFQACRKAGVIAAHLVDKAYDSDWLLKKANAAGSPRYLLELANGAKSIRISVTIVTDAERMRIFTGPIFGKRLRISTRGCDAQNKISIRSFLLIEKTTRRKLTFLEHADY